MRRKRILVLGAVVASLCCLDVAIRNVSIRTRPIPDPPFPGCHETADPWKLYTVYAADEAEGDKLFKGKIIYLYDGEYDKGDVRTDEAGEKYLSVYGIVNLEEVLGWGEAIRRREVARCYLHRPDDPVMEHAQGSGGLMGHNIKGVCVGKIDGVVVLRKCYLVKVESRGTDW